MLVRARGKPPMIKDQVRLDGAARLVSRHLYALVAEARREGVPLDALTLELAAHATCAALSFWSGEDLRQVIEAAENDVGQEDMLKTMGPFGAA